MNPTHIPSDAAPVLRAYGDVLRFHLGGAETGGAFTMFTDHTPPGGGPPPHFHLREDEWWYVAEGKAEFLADGAWVPVGAGGAVFMPRDTLHAFRNAGDGPLRTVIHTTPSGFEDFFRRSHEVFARGGQPDPAEFLRVGAEHGIHFPGFAPADASLRGVPALPPAIVQPGEGRVLRAFGEEVTVLLDGRRTGGAFTCFVETTPPGGGPPPHWHEREDEWFLVLEGRVRFLLGDRWTEAGPGDAVLAPRGKVHTFRNETASPTRMLVHVSPSGFEDFFAEAAAEFARPGGPDMARAVAIAGAHGIRFAGP